MPHIAQFYPEMAKQPDPVREAEIQGNDRRRRIFGIQHAALIRIKGVIACSVETCSEKYDPIRITLDIDCDMAQTEDAVHALLQKAGLTFTSDYLFDPPKKRGNPVQYTLPTGG